ncbi:MAG: GNAT family N-acetyltransferase [Paludibacter sp.]
MLNFHRISNVSEPFFEKMYNLYIRAFPLKERRSWDGLEHELLYEKKFNSHALLQNNQFVGFFNYWTFDRFIYIEHFAIVDNMRNQNIGSEVIGIFKENANLPIILEVELPNNPLAIRRIEFYKRLGFSVLSNDYKQPPYEGEGDLIPMKIMCNDVEFGTQCFDVIKETLYSKVYNWK